MAVEFNDASNEYLSNNSPPVTSEPLTLAAWFYSDDLVNRQALINITDESDSEWGFSLVIRGDVGGDPIQAHKWDQGSGAASSTTGYSSNTWHHGCAVFASTVSRTIYLDGGSSASNTTNVTNIITYDSLNIGAVKVASPTAYMSGRIAEAAIWNAALTAAEAAALAAGYSPLLIRPANLVFYVPLVRDADEDIVGGLSLTANGTPTVEPHPPIIYQTGQTIFTPRSVSSEPTDFDLWLTDRRNFNVIKPSF
jgi:hypothetical protein